VCVFEYYKTCMPIYTYNNYLNLVCSIKVKDNITLHRSVNSAEVVPTEFESL